MALLSRWRAAHYLHYGVLFALKVSSLSIKPFSPVQVFCTASVLALIRVRALGRSEAAKQYINRRCKIRSGEVQGQRQAYLQFPSIVNESQCDGFTVFRAVQEDLT